MKLRLSEAIRAGAAISEPEVFTPYRRLDGKPHCCVLGAAYLGTPGLPPADEAFAEYGEYGNGPTLAVLGYLEPLYPELESFTQDGYTTLANAMWRRNDDGKMSREQIADWLFETWGL